MIVCLECWIGCLFGMLLCETNGVDDVLCGGYLCFICVWEWCFFRCNCVFWVLCVVLKR